MYNQSLIKSSVTSPVQSFSKPTPTTSITDKTTRTVELEKGMSQPSLTRGTAPSINLGGM